MNNCLPTQLQRDHNVALSTLRDRNGPFRDISYEIRTKENRSIFPLYLFCMRLCNESRKRFEAGFFLSKRKVNEGAKRTDSSDMREECLEAFLFATKVLRRNIYLHQRCHFFVF